MTNSAERTALYRLYDSSERLLYVGITSDPATRFASHAVYKPWWPQVARQDISWLEGTRLDALSIEAAAIQAEQPKYNGKHNATPAPFDAEAWPTVDAPPRGKALALADLIRAEIRAGRWKRGMRLPDRGVLAHASGVGEGTADLAYKLLAKEGLLRINHGRGTFIA